MLLIATILPFDDDRQELLAVWTALGKLSSLAGTVYRLFLANM